MSEFNGSPAMTQDDALRPGIAGQPVDGSVPSAGSLIRQAREMAGLHIAALAVALKVPVKKLEALEADRLDLLPDAVFVRALAASVCRTLKIDAGQVLALLPQTGKPSLGQQHTPINAPFRSPGDGPGPSLLAQVSRPAVLAGLLLVLAALVLIFLPAAQQPGPAAESGAEPA
ncbi:helix-turn-helix domain-containing protein, partial [Polaromonas sp.]|uniref:helix-turn-helix domain-containing protein n=1 Tax=Polaromonas sp. TaxID=1869339 RepID=UPI003C9C7B23